MNEPEINPETGKPKTIRSYGGGLRSKTRTGRDGKPVEVFHGKVWIKSLQMERTFTLTARTEKSARRQLAVIQADPEKVIAAREAARKASREKKAASFTVAELFDAFKANYKSRGGSGFHGNILKAPRAFLGDHPAAAVTPALLDSYVRHREGLKRSNGERRVSDSTIRKEIIGIGTAYRWAKRKRLVNVNPANCEDMPRPKESFDPQDTRWLTDDELTRLREAAGPWLRNVIAWATETGMDKGKVLRLRWPELDLERTEGRIVAGRFAMLRDKTGKPIRQVLSAGAIEALRQAGKVRHASGTVFLNPAGQPIEEKALDWALGCAYKAAKIEGCNFRTFRHGFATRALRRGVPREVVARMMGHSTAFVTERYQHVADDQLEAAALALSGPERLTRGSIPPAESPTGARTGANSEATNAGAAQILAAQARRGAGVAEQGCLLSSCSR
jgi:integrase